VLNAAKTLQVAGKFDQAVAMLERGLTKKPHDQDLLLALGEVYLDCREYEAALTVYHRAVFDKETTVAQKYAAILNHIYLLRALGKSEEAADFQKTDIWIEYKKTGDKGLRIELAWLDFSQNKFDEALAQFEKLYEESSDQRPYIAHGRALCLRRARSRDEALKYVDSELSEEKQQTARLLIVKSQFLLEQGNLEAALACCTVARKQDDLDGYLVEAGLLYYLNRADEAEALLKSKRSTAESASAKFALTAQLAWMRTNEGKYEEARKLIAEIPEFGGAALKWSSLGSVHLAEQQYAEAAECYEKTLKVEPHEASACCNLAFALVKTEDESDSSTEHISQSKKSWLKRTLVNFEIGEERKSKEEERLNRAVALCESAIHIDGTYARAHACLGEISLRRKKPRDAESHFRKSIRESKADGDHTSLGALYVEMGRYDEAEQMLKDACIYDFSNPRPYVELSNLYSLIGHNRRAILALKEAAVRAPKNEVALRALGLAYMRNGELSEAARVLRDGIRELGQSKPWRLHLALGEVFAEMAEKMNDKDLYDDALIEIAKALCLNERSDEVHFYAGVVNYKVEAWDRARSHFQSCLDYNHDHFYAQQNLRKVTAILREQKSRADSSAKAGIGLASFSSICLVILWVLFLKQAGDMRITPAMVLSLSPVLLGAAIVGFVLPYLVKFKVPGVEAEISRPKEQIRLEAAPPSIGFGMTGVMPLRK
jgi:tetratricopeptide (TPR) repeat protein